MILFCLTLMLIGAGGLVTAFHAGLAVPDWPRSYGYNMFLFPLSLMQEESGRFYEHSHRLLASLVGLTALAMAIHTSIAERRGWVKVLAWGIGFGVLAQAILGGMRVTEISVTLAIAHGVFAQMVFASMAVLAASTSRMFYTLPVTETPAASSDRALTVALLGCLIVQLILGATLRHEGSGVMLHISMATIVSVMVLACGFRAWGLHGHLRPLYRTSVAMMAIVGVQLTLGVLALVFWTGNAKDAPTHSAIITTLHQMNGALLLATGAVLAAWTWRLLKPVAANSVELAGGREHVSGSSVFQ
jgi:cytochrome c oxidase assembly protein subunit 15